MRCGCATAPPACTCRDRKQRRACFHFAGLIFLLKARTLNKQKKMSRAIGGADEKAAVKTGYSLASSSIRENGLTCHMIVRPPLLADFYESPRERGQRNQAHCASTITRRNTACRNTRRRIPACSTDHRIRPIRNAARSPLAERGSNYYASVGLAYRFEAPAERLR